MHNHTVKLATVLDGLAQLSLYPEKVVVISQQRNPPLATHQQTGWNEEWVPWDAFVEQGEAEARRDPALATIDFWRGSFDHPLWILFSSGTTGAPNLFDDSILFYHLMPLLGPLGKPKPIVHRAGGMLLQAAKEFVICGDFVADDIFL